MDQLFEPEEAPPEAGAWETTSGPLAARMRPRTLDDFVGQELARRVRVLELAGVDPAAPLDDQVAQQRDVGRRAAESDQPEASPFAQDGGQRHAHGARPYRRGGRAP